MCVRKFGGAGGQSPFGPNVIIVMVYFVLLSTSFIRIAWVETKNEVNQLAGHGIMGGIDTKTCTPTTVLQLADRIAWISLGMQSHWSNITTKTGHYWDSSFWGLSDRTKIDHHVLFFLCGGGWGSLTLLLYAPLGL